MLLPFGEEVEGYDYRVINEREARASAGIMFLLGIISLFTVFGMRTLFWAELFSITFIVEFLIRVLISPRYAPYMVMGSFFVSNQTPEWVEAKPKKFAWILGAILGMIMTYFIVANIVSPIRMLTCVLCLILLFAESAFGICLGCILYKKINVPLEGNCPGGVCENEPLPRHNRLRTLAKVAILIGFIGMVIATFSLLTNYKYVQHEQSSNLINAKMDKTTTSTITPAQDQKSDKDCEVPQYAIAMGHKDMWLEHHGCPPITDKAPSTKAETVVPTTTPTQPTKTDTKKSDCVAPEWAVKIGHKEKWEEHNCK